MKIFHTFILLLLINTCQATNYCIPSPTNGVNGHSVAHVGLLALNSNPSNASTYYFLRDSLNTLTCYLIPGKTYKLYITNGTSSANCAAWIDYNNDTTFSSSEKLDEFAASANHADSITFTVPANCNKGKLRLRIRSSSSTTFNACSNYSSGQTVDYTITVLNPAYEYNFFTGWESASTATDYIDRIHFGTIDNPNSGSATGPVYNDYSYMITNVAACSSYYLLATTDHYTSSVNGNYIYAYIDFNNDGLFDARENVGFKNMNSTITTDSVLLAMRNVVGQRRLRITFSTNYIIREIEDYTVNLTAATGTGIPQATIGSNLFTLYESGPEEYRMQACVGTYSFFDNSCNAPTSWTWDAIGAVPPTSTQQNPTLNFPAPGVYTVKLTATNSSGSSSASVRVNVMAPFINFSLGNDTTICTGSSVTLHGPSFPPQCYTYQWSSGDNIQNVNVTSSGSYSVRVANCNHAGCPAVDTIHVAFSPQVFNITGGGAYCGTGSGVNIGLNNSEQGISYRLYCNNNPLGSAVIGNGNSISFPPQTTVGSYYIVATNNTASCSAIMNNTAHITAGQLPLFYSVSGGGDLCPNGSGYPVILSNSQNNYDYQLYRNGNSVSGVIHSNGGQLTFPVQTTQGTYTVIATDPSSGCSSQMTGSASINVLAVPTVYHVNGGGNSCANGTGVAVGIADSENGVTYELFLDGNPTGITITGNGSAQDFPNQTVAGTYTVVATNTACSSTMTGHATIASIPSPSTFVVSGGGSFCVGDPGLPVHLNNSDTSVSYQLYRNNSPVGSSYAGSGSPINFGIQTDGIYTVVGTDNASGCSVSMNNSVTLVMNPLPTLTFNLPAILCIYSAPMYIDANPAGGIFNGNGIVGDSLFPTTAGLGMVVFNYDYTDPSTLCFNSTTDSILVDLCTGIDENVFQNKILLYPNPVNEGLTIDFKSLKAELFSMEIINNVGQCLNKINVSLLNNSNFYLRTDNLSAGVYIIKFNFNQNIISRKIQVIH